MNVQSALVTCLLHFPSIELNTLHIVCLTGTVCPSLHRFTFWQRILCFSWKSQTLISWITETLPCKTYTGWSTSCWAWSKIFLKAVFPTKSSNRNLTGNVQLGMLDTHKLSSPVLLVLPTLRSLLTICVLSVQKLFFSLDCKFQSIRTIYLTSLVNRNRALLLIWVEMQLQPLANFRQVSHIIYKYLSIFMLNWCVKTTTYMFNLFIPYHKYFF